MTFSVAAVVEQEWTRHIFSLCLCYNSARSFKTSTSRWNTGVTSHIQELRAETHKPWTASDTSIQKTSTGSTCNTTPLLDHIEYVLTINPLRFIPICIWANFFWEQIWLFYIVLIQPFQLDLFDLGRFQSCNWGTLVLASLLNDSTLDEAAQRCSDFLGLHHTLGFNLSYLKSPS